MTPNPDNTFGAQEEKHFPPAQTGNASNPSPDENNGVPGGQNQLLNEKAEKYLRESASIEDVPDEQDWQDADAILKEEKESGENKRDQ